MKVSTTTLLAIVKASRPSFKSRGCRLAYAIHAFFLSRGGTVVAVGQQADDIATDATPTEEVDMVGWDDQQDHFAFCYLPEDGNTQNTLQVIIDISNDILVVHWASVNRKGPIKGPKSLQLQISDYTRDATGVQEGYDNLDQLVNKLNENFDSTDTEATSSSGEAVKARNSGAIPSRTRHLEEEPDIDDALTTARRPPSWPENGSDDDAVGWSDAAPPGLRAPGLPGGLSSPHLGGSMSGGMHVGPNDPLYSSRLQQGGRRLPRGVLPGARFDPITPQGLPGWNPDDFQRQGDQRMHPDIMQPGPGRGSSFDSMFG